MLSYGSKASHRCVYALRRYIQRTVCLSSPCFSPLDYAMLVEAPKEEQQPEMPKIPEYGFDTTKKGPNATITDNIVSATDESKLSGTNYCI